MRRGSPEKGSAQRQKHEKWCLKNHSRSMFPDAKSMPGPAKEGPKEKQNVWREKCRVFRFHLDN